MTLLLALFNVIVKEARAGSYVLSLSSDQFIGVKFCNCIIMTCMHKVMLNAKVLVAYALSACKRSGLGKSC